MAKRHRISSEVKEQILRRIKDEGISISDAAKEHGRERVYSVHKNPVEKFFQLLDQHAEKYCKNFCLPSRTS